jgi:hypothetical protein
MIADFLVVPLNCEYEENRAKTVVSIDIKFGSECFVLVALGW